MRDLLARKISALPEIATDRPLLFEVDDVVLSDLDGSVPTIAFTHDGAPGKKVRLTLSAPGHIPAESKTVIALDGQVNVQRYFAPSPRRCTSSTTRRARHSPTSRSIATAPTS